MQGFHIAFLGVCSFLCPVSSISAFQSCRIELQIKSTHTYVNGQKSSHIPAIRTQQSHPLRARHTLEALLEMVQHGGGGDAVHPAELQAALHVDACADEIEAEDHGKNT